MNKGSKQRDPAPSAAKHALSGAKICIVTGELAGPDFNGGIGTTNRALALFLRSQGHDVDVLYTRVNEGNPFSVKGRFGDQVEAYRQFGIRLACIDNPGAWNDWQAKSYLAMQHLLRNTYDIVFFDDTHGTAYYPLLARKTGCRELQKTTMIVTAHSATQWIADLNRTPVTTFEELRLMEMERRTIELADVLKAPSEYILRKYKDYGWAISPNSIILPNLISDDRPMRGGARRVAIKEIVFFGRLEYRKGFWMFCRVIDRLKYKLDGVQITFLGKATVENRLPTDESLVRLSAGWPFHVRLLSTFDRDQALTYLKGPGRLAVIASPEDNSPSAILECLEEGIPFIACSGSGGEELLDKNSRAACLVEPSVEGLLIKLHEVLAKGTTIAGCSFDRASLQKKYEKWLQQLKGADRVAKPVIAKGGAKPVLLVIVPAEFGVERSVGELVRAAQSFDGQVEIEALASNPGELRQALSGRGRLPIAVSDIREFAKVARSLTYRNSTAVGICHISQILDPEWFQRAQACFAGQSDLFALTGMVVGAADAQKTDREPFFSTGEKPRKVERFLMGNASALLPLLQETNSGYALMRSGLLAELSMIGPLDEKYGSLKRMGDWIHEILLGMRERSMRFELVPDQAVSQSIEERPSEVFQLARVMRPLATMSGKYAPGSDPFLLGRLSIDVGLEWERNIAHRHYREYLAERTGRPVLWGTADERFEIADLAHAGGQIALAVDLVAASTLKAKSSAVSNLDALVKFELESASLFELASHGKHKTLNLDQSYSLQILNDSRSIVLHANSTDKGMAALIFSDVDLQKLRFFSCELTAPDAANPLRFRLELSSSAKSRRWSAEKVLRPGEVVTWEFEVPEEVRGVCRIMIGVEMADAESSSENAFARWQNPRFLQRRN